MTNPERIHSVDRLLQIARDTIEKAGFAFLVTHGTDGNLYARLMQPFAPDEARLCTQACSKEQKV